MNDAATQEFEEVRTALQVIMRADQAVAYCVDGRVPSGLVIIGGGRR